ncbi:MAG: hydrogenase iron-sulfur subunit [Bacteroidetes bacterium]|nr:MAG: hydrogenase iron-sulfur subunit [Bacteroidota bacterium]
METKVGMYLCSGCEIGGSINCQAICETVQKETKIPVSKINSCLCGDLAIQEIRKDIEVEGLNRVVIGACSPRYMTEVFRFGENVLVDRVNIREHVCWSHKPNEEETDALAKDYLKMGVVKMQNSDIPQPMILDINDTVMVVGGGVTGMNAALSSAKAGYNVVLVEKEKELGGYYKKLYKLTPRKAPYTELEANPCDDLIAEIMSNDKIKVLTNCTLEETAGQPGAFNVTAKINGDTQNFVVGTIIQATGWKPYEPEKLSYLGYGSSKNIVTNVEFEELAKNNNLKKPSDNGAINSIVFIQCAGSRDKEHLPYCSSICCMTSLKQALYVQEKYPNAKIYIIYKDFRTPANYELFLKRVQNEDTIFLTKGEIAGVNVNNGTINVDVDNTFVGEKIQIQADMVVLAAGMMPNSAADRIKTVKKTENPSVDSKPAEEKPDEAVEPEYSVLNLKYIQGKDLPTLHYGFPDSHYICFPYETRRTAIYAAGTVRNPMDTVACKNDALGASLKAIQALEAIRKGIAVHPRSGDKTYPDFFFQRCTQCKRCTEECPFGALEEDVKGTPMPNPNRCRRCGICMGACPERIVSFKDYSVPIISAMIKSIDMPEEDEEKPRIIAFMCENDAYPSLDIAARKRMLYTPNIRVIPVRCLGSVSTSWINDALAAGFDGAILIGCKYGDDYQCHFIRGSELANIRMENVQEKLKQLVLEPERVEIHTLSIDEYDRLPDIFNKFAETIDEVGPNPYKDL